MSTVQPIPTASTSPDRQGAGSPFSAPPLVTPSLVIGHSPTLPTLPALTPDQDRLFEALAKGQTSPSELAATLGLPVRHILTLLATPEITFHLQVLESAIDYLARHTTRLRHALAFKSLESALDAAAAKDNPGEIRRIATLLLKPTPPLPDPEAEQAERAERLTKHRRAVKQDAKSEQQDAEYTALARPWSRVHSNPVPPTACPQPVGAQRPRRPMHKPRPQLRTRPIRARRAAASPGP
ncbi:MAG: hypothetical protein ACREJO_13245 [Phycisphaerales bacterium]